MRVSGVRPPPGIQQEDRDGGDAGPVDGKWKNDGPLRTGARGTRHALDLRRYLGKYWGVRRLYVRRNSVPERGTVPPPPDSCGRTWSIDLSW